MEISYQISYSNSRNAHTCDITDVANSSLFTGTNINCQYGCSGTIISPISYVCTYFNADDDWAFGEYHITYNFSQISFDDIVTIGTAGGNWIREVGNGNWNISTTFSLTKRNDTGRINSSPRVLPIPALRLQSGCRYTIPLPVSDPDNDTVRCRWAVGNECSSICNQLTGATLDANTCAITYTASFGIRAAAIMIEDYAPGSPHRPLSSVALQFLIIGYSSFQSCPSQTDFFNFPSITLNPSNKAVFLNQNSESTNLTLTCMTNETALYYWERQNGSVPINSIGIFTNTLTLVDVQPEDSGNYRCAVFADYSACCRSFSEYAAVTIINGKYVRYVCRLLHCLTPRFVLCLILGTFPVFVSYPTPQHVNLTQTAIFTCNATGYNVSYQWTIGSGSFPNKVIGIDSNTLVIPDVRSSDDNTYTCVASNEDGNASSNATKLTVIGMI